MEFIISGNTSYTYLFVLISPLDNCFLIIEIFLHYSNALRLSLLKTIILCRTLMYNSYFIFRCVDFTAFEY